MTRPQKPLVCRRFAGDHSGIEAPIEHRDVTTIMILLGNIQHDINRIRRLLEDELGEETQDPEDDA
jgi:hypothetical protein